MKNREKDQTVNCLMQKLKTGQKMTIGEIQELFRQRQQWPEDLYLPLARRALDAGENFYAYDIAEKIVPPNELESWKKNHIMALALARSGSPERAAELLRNLPDSENTEIAGLKSRILKDMAINTADAEKSRELFFQAADLSLKIFEAKQQYYNGINAASCLFMADRKAQAQALVKNQVIPLCKKEKISDLWLTATLGECYLLLEDYAMAGKYYEQTVQTALSQGKMGNLASTLKQLYMLSGKIPAEKIQYVISRMHLPQVAIFSGHMIDRPDRKTPRFPPYAEEQVRRDLAGIIRSQNIRIAFVSCACGGDILFIEEILKNGGECFILPPLPLDKTIKNSVDIIPGADWKQRLEKIMENEDCVMLEPESDEIGVEDDAMVYDFTNRVLLGLAINWAQRSFFPLCGIAVWNREKSGLIGGTDSAVALWMDKKIPVKIVAPEIKK